MTREAPKWSAIAPAPGEPVVVPWAAVAPSDLRLQCPACGAPVASTTVRVVRTPDDAGYGVALECGHTVTAELVRDAWGIDLFGE